MNDLLQQGITAYKAGKRDEARRIIAAVVKQNPNSEHAWGWMSNVCNTDQERIHCLKQVVRINPQNEKARQQMERLLTPSFAAELPLSPVSSVPQSPVPSKSKASRRSTGFTSTQLFVLVGLVATLFLMFGAAFMFLFTETEQVVVVASPTGFVALSSSNTPLPTRVLPTATLIPTYAYAATWTPLPSPTSFVLPTLVPPTAKPQLAQNNPAAAANPPSGSSGSNCAAQLEYAKAVHQYNLDMIDYIHAPLISLYESWIDEALGDRDALGVVKAERALDNEKAQVKAENKRYKAEQASINASCQ